MHVKSIHVRNSLLNIANVIMAKSIIDVKGTFPVYRFIHNYKLPNPEGEEIWLLYA